MRCAPFLTFVLPAKASDTCPLVNIYRRFGLIAILCHMFSIKDRLLTHDPFQYLVEDRVYEVVQSAKKGGMILEGILVETVAFAAGRCGELIGTDVDVCQSNPGAHCEFERLAQQAKPKGPLVSQHHQLAGASTASSIHCCPPRHNSPVNSSSCCWTPTSTSSPQSVM